MRLAASLGLVLVGTTAWAQPPQADLEVRPRPPEGAQITPYLRSQIDRAWAQDARRQARLDAIRSEAELLEWQAEIRKAMIDAIGGLPETRTPLNAKVVGTEVRDGYRVERVVFESLPGVHVTALVYVPDTPEGEATEKRPAVLLACGHARTGKSFENYQRIAARLARLGYVVICWDPIGQGERSQFWEVARNDTRYDRVCGEHGVLGNLATLAGANLARWMVWDGIRAVDYLLTRAEVDPARLAITGTSGGGFQSAWIGALDTRIAVVAPSAFMTALPMRMANRIFEDPDSDPEQDPPGLVSAGIDHVGILLAAYPRRIHVSAVARDFFPIEGTRLTMRRVKAVYERFGHGDRVVLSEAYARHSYAEPNQLSAFRFFARTFGLREPDALPDVSLLSETQLQVTRSGQVRLDLPGRSLVDVIREYYEKHRAERASSFRTFYEQARAAHPTAPGETSVRISSSSTWQGIRIDRYLLEYGGGLEVPVLHLRPAARATASAPALLHVDLRGKVDASRWGDVARALADGRDVISLDLPGAGELRMPFKVASQPWIEALSDEERHAHPLSSVMGNYIYNGILTGRPYLVDAVETIAVVHAFARQRLGVSDVRVLGPGVSAALAEAATVLPDLTVERVPGAEVFDPRRTVVEGIEMWPIEYLLPGAAYMAPTTPDR